MPECSGLLLGIRGMLAVVDVHIRHLRIRLLRIRHLLDRPLKDHLNFSSFSSLSIVFRIKYQPMSKCTDRIVAAADRSTNLRHHLRFPFLRSWNSRKHSHHSQKPNVDYNLRSYTETDVDRLLLEPAKGGKFCYFATITASHPLVGKQANQRFLTGAVARRRGNAPPPKRGKKTIANFYGHLLPRYDHKTIIMLNSNTIQFKHKNNLFQICNNIFENFRHSFLFDTPYPQ